MDRLTSLTVFTRVVDSGGFSAAARRLNMSTTMVSNHVQSLEQRLGARLLNRTTRRVSMTEVGKAYYERCTRILSELEEADRAAGALQSTPSGTLRLYTSTHIVRFIAPVLAEYLALYPKVAVEHFTGDRMIDLVEEGFDVAVRTTLPPDSSLVVRRLTPWRHFLCCAPAYIERHGAPQHPADLAGRNCLRFAYYPYGDEWHFTGPDGKPVTVRVSGNLLTSSGEALAQVALSGQGLFLAPSFLIGPYFADGRLVSVLDDYRPVEFAINAIYPHRVYLSAKVRSFIDLAVERFAEHRKWMDPEAGA